MTPNDGQRLLLNHLDNEVDKLVRKFLHEPKTHSVDGRTRLVAQMTHHVFEAANATDKHELVRELAPGTGRHPVHPHQHQAKKLARKLTAEASPPSTCGQSQPGSATATSPRFRGDGARAGGHRDVAAAVFTSSTSSWSSTSIRPPSTRPTCTRSGRTALARPVTLSPCARLSSVATCASCCAT